MSRKLIKNIFEFTIITKNFFKLINIQTKKYIIINSKDSSKITSVKCSLDNFFVILREKSIIISDLNQEKYSEIPWKITGTEKYNFKSYNLCVIANNEGFVLIGYAFNKKFLL